MMMTIIRTVITEICCLYSNLCHINELDECCYNIVNRRLINNQLISGINKVVDYSYNSLGAQAWSNEK